MFNFKYYAPTKIFFGRDEEKKVGAIIKEYGFKKILIHFGQKSVIASGLLQSVTDALEEVGINYILFGGVEPNPKLSTVLEGIKICKTEKIEMILAIGGGSVIDSAKHIAIGAKSPDNPWVYSIKQKEVKAALPVGCILTIAAAGSEMSQSCVITNDQTLEKRGFNSEFNRPLFAIENPVLTYTVSKFQTGCGIVDIMMHTLERYFSKGDESNITDYIAEGVLKAVIEAGSIAINKPDDYNARATLMWASSLSHNDITGVGRKVEMPVHQIEHEISGMFDYVAHGAGLSAIFSSWARFVYRDGIERFGRFAYEVMQVKKTDNPELDAINGIERLEQFFKEIDMPTSLSELKIPTSNQVLEELAQKFTYYGQRKVDDFKEIGYEEALTILYMAK